MSIHAAVNYNLVGDVIVLTYVMGFFVPYNLYIQRLSHRIFGMPSEMIGDDDRSLLPYTLEVPKLEIKADVEFVGLNRKGSMETPSNFKTVGWYKHGISPGKKGNAVFAGHVDNALGGNGIFSDIDDLALGDTIVIKDSEGKELVFIVEEMEIVPWLSAPLEKIFGKTDKKRLNLITCTGEWNDDWQTYDDRLIIYATLEE